MSEQETAITKKTVDFSTAKEIDLLAPATFDLPNKKQTGKKLDNVVGSWKAQIVRRKNPPGFGVLIFFSDEIQAQQFLDDLALGNLSVEDVPLE